MPASAPIHWHLLGRNEDASVVGYSRILPPGLKYPEPSIGRVVTHPEARGAGLGKKLMQQAVKYTTDLFPGEPIRIGAQMHLVRCYSEFGFEPVGEPYGEDGIPHVEMLRASAAPTP